jgi:hypothetical protein
VVDEIGGFVRGTLSAKAIAAFVATSAATTDAINNDNNSNNGHGNGNGVTEEKKTKAKKKKKPKKKSTTAPSSAATTTTTTNDDDNDNNDDDDSGGAEEFPPSTSSLPAPSASSFSGWANGVDSNLSFGSSSLAPTSQSSPLSSLFNNFTTPTRNPSLGFEIFGSGRSWADVTDEEDDNDNDMDTSAGFQAHLAAAARAASHSSTIHDDAVDEDEDG